MTYRYTDNDKPLVRCPECGTNLTDVNNIELWLSAGGRVFDVRSRLNDKGELQDTEDGAVANGFHSTTCCARCGEQLIDLDGVEEDKQCV